MPTNENSQPGKLMYQVSEGVWAEIPSPVHIGADFATGSDATNTSAYFIHGDDAVEICGTFGPPDFLRKRLSRKRIRKVLMSIGIQRNVAEAQSRDMVQKLDMNFRVIELLAIVLTDLKFEVET